MTFAATYPWLVLKDVQCAGAIFSCDSKSVLCILLCMWLVFFSKLLQTNNGNTALIKACEHGHIETARVLLDHGAVVDYQNKVKFFYTHWMIPTSITVTCQQFLFDIVEGLFSFIYIEQEWLCWSCDRIIRIWSPSGPTKWCRVAL